MTISGVSGRTSYIGTGILNLRSQLDTLTQQLASGKISTTYAGQGDGRSLAVGLRAQIAGLASYADTATNVNTRLDVMNLSLTRLTKINSEVKGAAVAAGNTLDNTGQTAGQKTASLDFLDSVDMLNAQSGDRYLFSGRATDTSPVTPADVIMNGNGAGVAGLKQVIADRLTADLGTVIPGQPATGRISSAVGVAPTAVTLTEQDTTPAPPLTANPFGIKLTAVATSLTNTGATVTQPVVLPTTIPPALPAAPAQRTMSVDLGTSVPQDGDTIKFTFKMPDGTSEDIVMTASATTPLAANSFLIGANNTATAASLNTELTKSIQNLANGPMAAASAIQAGNEFFGEPPQRIATAPLDTATTMVAGTKADTVFWYNGEADSATDPARGTAVARVDEAITVQYGARADEQALRVQLQAVAVFAAVSTKVTDFNASGKIAALSQRVAQNLAIIPGTQTIQDIQADVAGAQASIKATADRQVQTKTISQTMLDSIEGINNDEVATKILALQTALQASYQTTSDLYKMSLVKFL
ncbi:MAG: flagellar biosynthesis protein FlgL [Rhodopseudomonas sp.]|uniref:flagellar biosynthesis protein FlgL n=1 Tax=Rhodopseudomonas sp. TaxID=1078 RepID=UPI001840B934|nr:flagellar biosynthesis protein FlgL [Rhodopseudomonas sp.]NVN84709.1 flagellar biosynthesis protein FlgL [Rhodopseudomonas sp.]